MEDEMLHFRHITLYEFRKRISVGTALKTKQNKKKQKTFKGFIYFVPHLFGRSKSCLEDFPRVILT